MKIQGKKLIFGLFLGFARLAIGDNFVEEEFRGGYLGLQIGSVDFNYSNSPYVNTSGCAVNKSFRFTFQGYLGYSFSKYLGMELSYQYYGNPRFERGSERQYILQQGGHLMGRLNLPLANNLSIYLRGGAGLVFRSSLEVTKHFLVSKPANRHLVPVGGLGLCYWMAKDLAFDLSVTSTVEVSDLPSMQTYAVGLIYRF